MVDDAIIIADNIKEKYEQGLKGLEALQVGVTEVLAYRCIRFNNCLSIYSIDVFDGYFGIFIKYISLIVVLMLAEVYLKVILFYLGTLSYLKIKRVR